MWTFGWAGSVRGRTVKPFTEVGMGLGFLDFEEGMAAGRFGVVAVAELCAGH
jgi:hypothetical protein